MNPSFDPIASPAMMVPSITAWGSCKKIRWSLHVPGSLSSPLINTYLGFADCLGTNDHFSPVGNPAPPRPRRLEAFISLTIHSGPWAIHFFSASYPPSSMYLSIFVAPMPKRFVTIFTSSGCDTSLGIVFLVLNLLSILIQDRRHIVRLQLIVKRVIHLDGRCPAARPDAFHFFEREHAVWRNSLVTDAELLLKSLIQLVRPAQHATDVGAHLHVEFARGLESQHGVISRDVAHFERGDREPGRDFIDHWVGKVADLILRIEQHGNQRRPLGGILRHQRVKARGQLRRKDRNPFSAGACTSVASTPFQGITAHASTPPPPLQPPYPSLPRLRPFSAVPPQSAPASRFVHPRAAT